MVSIFESKRFTDLGWRIRWRYQVARSFYYRHIVTLLWAFRRRHRPATNGLEIIVSLTSYPPRFANLSLTLRCLLRQSLRPDKLVLWIAQSDMHLIPASVHALTAHGLEILPCEDLGSYKKIIPALARFPESIIVTADDDLFFPRNWLADLVAEWSKDPHTIVCHRAHGIRHSPSGSLLPYGDWENNIGEREAGPEVFPTSGAGVLYPPGSLHRDVGGTELFLRICPNADDLWLYWMARRAGWSASKVGPAYKLIEWDPAAPGRLWLDNLIGGGNDVKIKAMLAAIGPPLPALSAAQ